MVVHAERNRALTPTPIWNGWQRFSKWADDAGWEAILVYTDNLLVDPWLVSQLIIQNTKQLRPLVAIQPIYMHPYSVAKMVTSFSMLYGRAVYLNFVAGGFKRDLQALNDTTPHDLRYQRIIEYATIIRTFVGQSPRNVRRCVLQDERPLAHA